MKMYAKSIADVLPILGEMVREGIWESRKEAVEEFKLRRERREGKIRHAAGHNPRLVSKRACPFMREGMK